MNAKSTGRPPDINSSYTRFDSSSSLLCAFGIAQAEINSVNEIKVNYLVKTTINKWVSDPMVIEAILQQNADNRNLAQSDIDALDQKWRAQRKSDDKSMIDGILANQVSDHLRKAQSDSKGLFPEIFIMDNKGLNVGQSDETSDYWQGDEDKWQKSYLLGSGSVFVDGMEFDESAGMYLRQISVSIADPKTGETIGAITVGVDVLRMLELPTKKHGS